MTETKRKIQNGGKPATATASAVQTQRRIRNILLIEDDADTRYVLKSLLNDEGYSVRDAVDRDEAVGHLPKALYQVILMDFFMPGKSADDFLRQVRKTSPGCIIVLITAAENAENAAASLGLKHFLGKPLDSNNLLALLERLEHTA
jgi:CheY-like chemotaxis protein